MCVNMSYIVYEKIFCFYFKSSDVLKLLYIHVRKQTQIINLKLTNNEAADMFSTHLFFFIFY